MTSTKPASSIEEKLYVVISYSCTLSHNHGLHSDPGSVTARTAIAKRYLFRSCEVRMGLSIICNKVLIKLCYLWSTFFIPLTFLHSSGRAAGSVMAPTRDFGALHSYQRASCRSPGSKKQRWEIVTDAGERASNDIGYGYCSPAHVSPSRHLSRPSFQCLQPQPQRGAQDQVKVLLYGSNIYLSTLR